MNKPTYDEVMAEINMLVSTAREIKQDGCLGDMELWLDTENVKYNLIDERNENDHINNNQIIRDTFTYAVERKLAPLWQMARQAFEREFRQ